LTTKARYYLEIRKHVLFVHTPHHLALVIHYCQKNGLFVGRISKSALTVLTRCEELGKDGPHSRDYIVRLEWESTLTVNYIKDTEEVGLIKSLF
jgi:hypothetical protein